MQRVTRFSKSFFFFFLGATLAALILICGAYIFFSVYFQQRVYPGVKIDNLDVSEQTQEQIIEAFADTRFDTVDNLLLELSSLDATISTTTKEIGLNIDSNSMARRAFSIGRQTTNPYYNLLQIISAFNGQINLPLEINLDQNALDRKLDIVAPQIEKPAVNAVYKFNPQSGPDNTGRVEAFSPSAPGLLLDREKISASIISIAKRRGSTNEPIKVPLFIKVVLPEVQSSTADKLGIKTLIGHGESFFYDSIPSRVYNIQLGTQKVSGKLIAPDDEFSFNDSIGTISALFGFQKAYAIIKNKTVLDDGGGVCQVSTTIYRAALNAGLPITKRSAHAYRVGFYEQGGFKPGLDATVYPPDPDFRFKNDTGHWLLLQANFDEVAQKLTFEIFGTSDGRKTIIEGPIILSETPPPEPIYEDDPNLPVGQQKQVDTAHYGAKTSFTRTVTRDGEILIKETVISNYIPWPARFLRGTKI